MLSDKTDEFVPNTQQPDELADTDFENVDTTSKQINHDLPCLHCGYNLRGMAADKRCPECGMEVGRSLRGDQLRYSDPRWVRTIARGANLIMWSVIAFVAMILLGIVVSLVLAENHAYVPDILPIIFQLLLLLPAVLFAAGVWIVTIPEFGVLESSGWSLRNVLRWAMVFFVPISILDISLHNVWTMDATVLDLAAALVGLVVIVTLFLYAHRLTIRIPDYELAIQIRIVTWGDGICLAGYILLIVFVHASGINRTINGFRDIAVLALALLIGLLVFIIWSFILTIRCRSASYAAAKDAEQTCATGSPQPQEAA